MNFGPEYFEFFGGVEQGVSYPLTDSDIFWPYPFEYGATWNDSMSGTLNVQGVIINRSGTTESTNNGFGSLSMPGGAQLDDVTRVEMTREITDSSFTGVNIYVVHQIRFHHGNLLAPLVIHTNFQVISGLDTTVTNSTEVFQSYTVGLTSIAPPKEEFGMFPNPARDDVQVVWSSFSASSNCGGEGHHRTCSRRDSFRFRDELDNDRCERVGKWRIYRHCRSRPKQPHHEEVNRGVNTKAPNTLCRFCLP